MITVLLSVRYLEDRGRAAGEYYLLILCATLGMMFMASGIDLITIFIGLETMALSFYILAGYIKPSSRSNEAAVKYFLLGAFSLGILLYGMSLLYGGTGTTNLREMAPRSRPGRRARSCAWCSGSSWWSPGRLQDGGGAVPHLGAGRLRGAPTPMTAFLSVGRRRRRSRLLVRIFIEGLPGDAASIGRVLLFWCWRW